LQGRSLVRLSRMSSLDGGTAVCSEPVAYGGGIATTPSYGSYGVAPTQIPKVERIIEVPNVAGARPTVGDMVRVVRPRSGMGQITKAHELYLNKTGRIIKDLKDDGYGQPYQIEGMTSNEFHDDIWFFPDELEGGAVYFQGGGIATTPSYGSYGVAPTQIHRVERIIEVPNVQTVERIVEVPVVQAPKIITQEVAPTQIHRVERIIEVPNVQTVERIVEVPIVEIETVERQVPKIITQEVVRHEPVIQTQTQERLVEVPQIIMTERIVEIPQVQIQVVIREVPKVITQEVVKHVPKIIDEVREIVVEVPEIQTIEHVVEVPQMQVQIVDREVPKIVTQEVVRQVPKISNQVLERLIEVPQIQTIERIVEVPQIQVEEVIREVNVPQTVYAEPMRTCQRVAATPVYSGGGGGIASPYGGGVVRTASHGVGGMMEPISSPYGGGGVLGSSTIM